MLKKFFFAAIVAVLMLSSQIVSAANDVIEIYYIYNKAELFRHIEDERRLGHTEMHVLLAGGFKLEQLRDSDGKNFTELANLLTVARVVMNVETYLADGSEELTFTITEYPGTRVANAYLRGNKDGLTMDEVQLYDKAVEIVNEAKKRPSILAQEHYIHNEICRRVSYEVDKNTAISALVYGKADCDGYADTFYMLCRMMGWNVGRIFGGNHAWNWIDFGDGKVYCVDVQRDDEYFDFGKHGKANGYLYFNAPEEIIAVNHTWDRELLPNLQRTVDGRYAYRILSNHAFVSSPQEGWDVLAQKLSGAGNGTLFYVMAPFSENQGNYHGRRIVFQSRRFGNYFIVTAFAR